ncbi:hypothetical protein [Caulobacter sp. S45]|uniref:hypothetical protein n=1 Tax=Caulobacter sp. S45 TaxID=1641861 RepID=UPI00131B091C|nr:hypothetical protein [Caulobacter sp. S45]
MSANPFRADPELCAIGQQSAAERRRRRQLLAQRANRPDDGPERSALQAACARYAERHGVLEAHGVLALELARYTPDLPGPRSAARDEAERLFKRGGA